MPNVTQDEALRIAQAFARFANTVEDYRFDHFAALTNLQRANLLNLEGTLRATSNNFLNFGINLALDNVQTALDQLSQVTELINSDLKVLADINKAIQVIGVLVQLGTAFATGSPGGIISALQGAVTDLTAAAAPAKTASAAATPSGGGV
jgi:hypothetical protein